MAMNRGSVKTDADYMRYFIYSAEQFNIRKNIEAKLGKVFKAGIVIINGHPKEFTEMTKEVSVTRYPDIDLVAYVDMRTVKYTLPDGV